MTRLLGMLPEPMLVATPGGTVAAVNAALAGVLGRAARELVGVPASALVSEPPDRLEAYLAACARASGPVRSSLRLGGDGRAPVRYRAEGWTIRGGSPRASRWAVIRFVAEVPDAVRVVSLARSPGRLACEHRRRRVEAALGPARGLLRALIEGIPDAVFVTDRSGRYLAVNEAGAEVLGRSVEEVLGRSDDELLPREVARALRARDLDVLGLATAASNEDTVVSSGGCVRTLATTRVPYRDADGSVAGVIRIAHDSTTGHEGDGPGATRRALDAAVRAKGTFLAALSHELRSPLEPIVGWAQVLRDEMPDAATMGRALEAIERNAVAQLRLVENLLDLGRIVTGKLLVRFQAVELGRVVERALAAVASAAAAKGLRLEARTEDPAGPVYGDPDRLQQVVWNLLANAVKFTPPGGMVAVEIGRVGQHAEVAVRDTGQGIARDYLPHVFQAFSQGDSSMSREHGGLGIGLALVRQIVEAHGGSVVAESPGQGRGAVFTVRLPLQGFASD